MRRLSHPPLAFWSVVTLLLVVALVTLRSDGHQAPEAGTAVAAEAVSDDLMRATASYPSGSGALQARAWLEGVRELALAGAEIAQQERDSTAASLWADLLSAVSSAMEEDLTARQVAERSSMVSFRVHVLSGHYRMRLS